VTPFNSDQLLDGNSGGTPGGEVGEFAISDMAPPDQQAARPQAAALLVELASVDVEKLTSLGACAAFRRHGSPARCLQET
jgi:hypothetical protein